MGRIKIRKQTSEAEYFIDIRNSGEMHIARRTCAGVRNDFSVPIAEISVLSELIFTAHSLYDQSCSDQSNPPRQSPPRFSPIRAKHPRAYLPWTSEEDQKMLALHMKGKTVAEIAVELQRQPSAIRSRLDRS